MSRVSLIKDYKHISDRQLELMDDSQLITTRNMLKADLNSGKSDPEGLIMVDYNRVCVRIAERFERCYTFGCVPGAGSPGQSDYIAELKSQLAACQNKLENLQSENRRLAFELTGVQPEPDSEPDLPFYYPDADDDNSDSCCDSVLIV